VNAKHAKYNRSQSDQAYIDFLGPKAAMAFAVSRNKWYLRLLKRFLPGLRRQLDVRAMTALNDRLYRAMRAAERATNAQTVGKSRQLPERAVSPKATTRETRARTPRTAKSTEQEPRT
jgi:hypothetical protein